MTARNRIDAISQIAIPVLTVLGYLLTSMKHPDWGLAVNLSAEPFWFYSSYIAYKEAGQIGMLVTTFILTGVLIYGVINYWFM